MKYRKKPVVIEAFQMTPERRTDNHDWPEWLNEAWNKSDQEPGALFIDAAAPSCLIVRTLEGIHVVSHNDWIIRGIKGELYPCKPDIFAATYEEVE